MVATYDRHGIRFLYPENWELQEDQPEPAACCITLQSPGSGFWMLQVLESPQAPERLASEALQSIQQDYEDIEIVPACEEVRGSELGGFDLQFYCLDFLVCAHVRSFQLGNRSCVLLSQAEDSEYEQIAPVFLAITCSLIEQSA
jgi:hypothetical protein